MEVQEIEVQIGKDGQVELKVRGVKGKKCLDLTAELEKALGGNVLVRELTPEAEDEIDLGNVQAGSLGSGTK